MLRSGIFGGNKRKSSKFSNSIFLKITGTSCIFISTDIRQNYSSKNRSNYFRNNIIVHYCVL